MFIRAFILLSLMLTSACSNFSPDTRRQYSNTLANKQSWQRIIIPTQTFTMVSYLPTQFSKKSTLTVYIEGDGLAWISRHHLSSDPTPKNPLALKLALKHPAGNAAYLARPCQYTLENERQLCDKKYWSSHRFSSLTVSVSNEAITFLKNRFNAKKLILVGYSGGGAIATLVAARRDDVSLLVTIAGNLDHKAWTKQQDISALNASLNPADAWRTLITTPQIHFVGSKDNIMPAAVGYAFQQRFPKKNQPTIQVIDGFDHYCCWVENWSTLFSYTED